MESPRKVNIGILISAVTREMTELLNFMGALKFIVPEEKRVFCVHGEKETMFSFADQLRGLGFITETPEQNQSFNL